MFAAQLATPGAPMSFVETDAEQALPPGPTRTAIVTWPLSDESWVSA